MGFHQQIEETMSEIISHMLKRTTKVCTEDQLAIAQEYKEWIKCINEREHVPQNILFINTSTFEKKFP
tara:strand:+ start:167 stop:370 length:204 start_codon:yes stop_codon:yes gene_type:complete